MKRTLWTPTIVWLAAATAALVLAVAVPSEASLMGRVPFPAAQRLGQVTGAPMAPVLALVGFHRSQRAEIRSWIKGLRLDQDQEIRWVKMPVLNDPGSEGARRAAEGQLLAQHSLGPGVQVVPVFTDRAEFIRAAGLSGMEHASVLVIDGEGQVLARAEGRYDPGPRHRAARDVAGAALSCRGAPQSSFSPGW